jgi:hypothetical protein
MFKQLAIIAASATLILAITAVPAMAQTHLAISIGHHGVAVTPYAVVPAQLYPGYVWQPAHYVWTAYGYQLVPGMWVPPSYLVSPAYVAPQVYFAQRGFYGGPRGFYGGPRGFYGGPRGFYSGPRGFYGGPRSVYVGPRLAPHGFARGARFRNGHAHRW